MKRLAAVGQAPAVVAPPHTSTARKPAEAKAEPKAPKARHRGTQGEEASSQESRHQEDRQEVGDPSIVERKAGAEQCSRFVCLLPASAPTNQRPTKPRAARQRGAKNANDIIPTMFEEERQAIEAQIRSICEREHIPLTRTQMVPHPLLRRMGIFHVLLWRGRRSGPIRSQRQGCGTGPRNRRACSRRSIAAAPFIALRPSTAI